MDVFSRILHILHKIDIGLKLLHFFTSPPLYIGQTFASFHLVGKIPFSIERLQIFVREGAIISAEILSILEEIKSGPVALVSLRSCKNFNTSLLFRKGISNLVFLSHLVDTKSSIILYDKLGITDLSVSLIDDATLVKKLLRASATWCLSVITFSPTSSIVGVVWVFLGVSSFTNFQSFRGSLLFLSISCM